MSGALIADEQALRLSLTAKLVALYGEADGVRSAGVLVPAVLGDFARMLGKARIGDAVSERYRTEDGIAEIRLSAVKAAGKSAVRAEVRPGK